MNKRIKMKKHIYPYAEYGIDLRLTVNSTLTNDEIDSIFYNYLFVEIEKLDLYATGFLYEKTGCLTFGCNKRGSIKELLLKFEMFKIEMNKLCEFQITNFQVVDMWFPDRKLHDGDRK